MILFWNITNMQHFHVQSATNKPPNTTGARANPSRWKDLLYANGYVAMREGVESRD
jgi:hypothetical protein